MLELFLSLNWGVVFQIIMIDLLLGGDNAVIIALACRNLPAHLKMKGIFWGTFGAIALRVIFIFFAVSLLNVPFLKLVGGILLLWIALKLMLQKKQEHGEIKGATQLRNAIKTIIIADAVMSIDNVIAIAGAVEAAHPDHRLGLIIFGLLVSIPIIVWGSRLVLSLLTRWPWIATLGAALLGWIAGGLIMTDPILASWFQSTLWHNWISILLAIGVVALGYYLAKYKNKRH